MSLSNTQRRQGGALRALLFASALLAFHRLWTGEMSVYSCTPYYPMLSRLGSSGGTNPTGACMVLAKLGSENETNRHECQREICGEEEGEGSLYARHTYVKL